MIRRPPIATLTATLFPYPTLFLSLAQVFEHGLVLGGLLARQLDVAELALAEQRDFARLAFVGQRDELVARGRDFGQALDLDRDGRAGFLDLLAVFVDHGAPAAEAGPRQAARSEELREGQECVSSGRFRLSPYH